ncbi:MAG: diguanylate cyclase [Arenimonas sp.]|uniref:ligand-binding sensor domain-containing diguanylate cyclase n=1 Tax=Arenimonas sp. TaxID=1872635 RepID=UPI0025C2D65B|nr:diguanylate cyclase [Arenimonas sp.]MBW8367266.1 diguanylate cyclase [Arenimonas sp.]
MRSTPPLLAFLLALTCLLPAAAAATAIPGEPMLRHFSAEDTKATPTHLAITTGVNGEMYVGNVEGVLRHDGVDWTLTQLPGRSAARSLDTGADKQVYVGGYDTFGRLVRNGDGDLAYEELLTRAGLRANQGFVGIVWETIATDTGVYFRAEKSLHFLPYDTGEAKQWPLEENVRSFYRVAGQLYVRVEGRGLCRFEDGKYVLVPGGETFANRMLIGVLDQGDSLLLVSRDGLYRSDANGIEPAPGAASDLLKGKRSYVVQALADKSFVVGTLDGELIRVSQDLQLRDQIQLGPFGIQAMGLDREGGLWVASDGDLVRVSLPSPWTAVGQAQGVLGTPIDFEWHDGYLWIASTSGISRMTAAADGTLTNALMPWTEFEGHALLSTDAGLLVGQREGLRVLDPGASQPRSLYTHREGGVYTIEASDHVEGLVYAMGATELLLVRKVGQRWQLQAALPLDKISTFGMEESAPGVLWLGDSRGPLQRWQLDLDTGKVVEREVFNDARGLAVDPRAGTSVYQLDGRIHAVSGAAGFVLEGDRFVADVAPPFTLVDRPFELSVEQTPLGDYAYTSRQLWHRAKKDGEWQPLYPGEQRAAGYSYLRYGSDGVLRVSTWNGILQYNPGETAAQPQPLLLSMESVKARSPEGNTLRLPNTSGTGAVQVPPGHSLNLRFAMVSMESGAEFRYILHGVTPDWSSWTDRDLFVRALPPGDYVLEVEARTRNGRQAPAIRYHFRVEPRWYEQWWMMALLLLALASLAVAITLWAVRRRTERFLAANRRLEARIAERTRELEEVNKKLAELVTEDALTGVSNRRALENGLRREWYRCLDQRRPLSVLMIDVDNFKAYNDAHGHLEGDVQLRGIAQRLHQQHDPQRELLARYGGEEFALLMPGVHQVEATRRAESIRAAIASSDAGMTVSIGVAGFVPELQAEPESLLRSADAALYAAKRAGRNRVETDAG